jgi:pimeloyl-ACP methyl ester carboxylesterase
MKNGRARLRITAFSVATAAALLAGYVIYVGVEGSRAFVEPARHTGCATPLMQFGWAYEAINYDGATDAVLADERDPLAACSNAAGEPGDEIVTPDGVRVAAWYVPAGNGTGPTGCTIVLSHGWTANKTGILRYGKGLHETYNLLALDYRSSGQTTGTQTSIGYLERQELIAALDWLEREKGPSCIGVLGNSMGAAVAVAAARSDDRIDALVLDSPHARLIHHAERALDRTPVWPDGPTHPSLTAPLGAWAILLGASVRTGVDVSLADPIDAIAGLGSRPILILHGELDYFNLPQRDPEPLLAAGRQAGMDITLTYCPLGEHGRVVDACADDYGAWVRTFFDRTLIPDAAGPSR